MLDGGWWISFPWCFTLNLVTVSVRTSCQVLQILCIHRCINVNIVELYGSAGQRGSGAAASMHSSLYKAGIIAQMFLLDNDDELKILLA